MKKINPSLFEIFSEMQLRYRKLGLDILGNYSVHLKCKKHSNYVVKKNKLLCTSGGITNDEMSIIHSLGQEIRPKNILIIGNAYGISTLFMSLTFPNSKLVAFDKFRTQGIEITKKLLKGEKKKIVIKASTPEDLENIIFKYFKNNVDLIFVDAVHTDDMQSKEFEIYNKYLSKKSCVIFHDIISCKLEKSFKNIKKKFVNYNFKLLNKSTNGLGICVKGKVSKQLLNYLNYFSTEEKKAVKFINFLNDYFSNKKTKLFITPKHPQI